MKPASFLAFTALCAGSLVSCAPDEAPSVSRQERSGVWIDVRTPEEYASGHLDGAHNLPVDTIGTRIAAVVPDRHSAIHVYCRTGRRSDIARRTLLDLGYTNVTNAGAYASLKNR